MYYGVPVPVRYGTEYIDDCEVARCIYGGCIIKDHVVEKLGLVCTNGNLTKDWIINNLPIGFSLHCHRGYHSVLAIAHKEDKLLLTNYAKDRLQWISIDSVINMQHKYATPHKWELATKYSV